MKGGRGGRGQRGEEGNDRAGEGREHEGGEAARQTRARAWGSVMCGLLSYRRMRQPQYPTSARGMVSGGGVVGEPATQGGGAQAGEGASLGMMHGLAGEPEGVSDLLQGTRGLAV